MLLLTGGFSKRLVTALMTCIQLSEVKETSSARKKGNNLVLEDMPVAPKTLNVAQKRNKDKGNNILINFVHAASCIPYV